MFVRKYRRGKRVYYAIVKGKGTWQKYLAYLGTQPYITEQQAPALAKEISEKLGRPFSVEELRAVKGLKIYGGAAPKAVKAAPAIKPTPLKRLAASLNAMEESRRPEVRQFSSRVEQLIFSLERNVAPTPILLPPEIAKRIEGRKIQAEASYERAFLGLLAWLKQHGLQLQPALYVEKGQTRIGYRISLQNPALLHIANPLLGILNELNRGKRPRIGVCHFCERFYLKRKPKTQRFCRDKCRLNYWQEHTKARHEIEEQLKRQAGSGRMGERAI